MIYVYPTYWILIGKTWTQKRTIPNEINHLTFLPVVQKGLHGCFKAFQNGFRCMEGGYGYPVAMTNPIKLGKDTTTCLQKVISSVGGGVGVVMGQLNPSKSGLNSSWLGRFELIWLVWLIWLACFMVRLKRKVGSSYFIQNHIELQPKCRYRT